MTECHQKIKKIRKYETIMLNQYRLMEKICLELTINIYIKQI